MAIAGINISRTSFNLQTYSLLDSLRLNTLKLFLEQNRLSSGSKFTSLSEDPVNAAKAVNLTEVLEHQQQVLANIRHADSFLSTTDAAVGELSTLLTDAYGIASEMVNSTASQEERDSMAEMVQGIIQQLVMVGNRMYGDVYLFGGHETTEPPFAETYGGVEYHGDRNALTSHVERSLDVAFSINGADLFGALEGRVTGCIDLDPVLTTDTRVADMGGTTGRGIDKTGQVRISLDSPATVFSVDLSTADTIGDVVDMINAAAEDAGLTVGPGNDFVASLNAAGNGLEFTVGAGSITVEDVGGSVTARDFGIRGTAAGTLTGQDLNVRLTPMTTITVLLGGAGATLGSIIIDNGDLNATVDLSGAVTVQDILNQINGAGVEVIAEINEDGTGINVINTMSGLEMRIGESGDGTGTAELLGIRSLYGGTLLSDLNNGQGVEFRAGYDDLEIHAKDGSVFSVNLDGSVTVQDVIDQINAVTGAAVTASLAQTGNGIRLVDNTGGALEFSVRRANMSPAIDGLGLEKSTSGTEIVGDDVNGVEPDSVFSALIALHRALVSGGDDAEQRITLAAERLQESIDHSVRVQGVIGARSKAMQTRLDLTEDAVVATQALLSDVKDLDYTEAITRFQQAQTALQANLMTGARLLQMSLLDYI